MTEVNNNNKKQIKGKNFKPTFDCHVCVSAKLRSHYYLSQLIICSHFVQKLHIILDTISEHFMDFALQSAKCRGRLILLEATRRKTKIKAF